MESNTDTFNDSKEDGTHDSGVSSSLNTTANSEGTTGKETGDDSIPRIFLLSNSLDGAIVLRGVFSNGSSRYQQGLAYCAEQTSPNTKVTTENGGARLDSGKRTYPALTVGAIPKTFDSMPDRTTDGTHAEGTSEVAQGDPWAGIARVVHNVSRRVRMSSGV